MTTFPETLVLGGEVVKRGWFGVSFAEYKFKDGCALCFSGDDGIYDAELYAPGAYGEPMVSCSGAVSQEDAIRTLREQLLRYSDALRLDP